MRLGSRTETDKNLPRIVSLTPVLKQVLPQGAKNSLRSWLVRGEMLIGREVDTDHGVCLSEDSKVSKQHAVLHRHGDVVEIQDLESKNHTQVDGRPITRQQLHDGSVVRVGNSLLVLRFEKAGIVDGPKNHQVLHARILGPSSELCELRLCKARLQTAYSGYPDYQSASLHPRTLFSEFSDTPRLKAL